MDRQPFGVGMSGAAFAEALESCASLDNPMFRAVELLADAWGPALERSYRLGRADGYTAGRWDAEHDMAEDWAKVAKSIRSVLDQPTQADLVTRRAVAV